MFINDDRFLATVGSVSNIFNATGRLFWGYLVDRLPFKVSMLILSSCLISFVSTLYLTKFIAVKEIYMLWICSVMFCQCGVYVLIPTVTAKCFGQKNFTSIYALVFLIGVYLKIMIIFILINILGS